MFGLLFLLMLLYAIVSRNSAKITPDTEEKIMVTQIGGGVSKEAWKKYPRNAQALIIPPWAKLLNFRTLKTMAKPTAINAYTAPRHIPLINNCKNIPILQ